MNIKNADYVMTKLVDPLGHAQKAQVGVDLTVGKIEDIGGMAVFEGDSKLNRDLTSYEETHVINESDVDDIVKQASKAIKSTLETLPILPMLAEILDDDNASKLKKAKEELDKLGGAEAVKKEVENYCNTLETSLKALIASSTKVYYLKANSAYAVELEQGIELGDEEFGLLYGRSSLNRVGLSLNQCLWDPGFKTDKMGTTLYTGPIPAFIPVGTRIAQIVIYPCDKVTEAYNGQWQGVTNH